MKYLRIVWILGPKVLYYGHRLKKLVKHKDRYTFEQRWNEVHSIAQKILKYFRIDYILEGYEEAKAALNEGDKLLIINNHESLLDAVILLALIDNPFSFIIKTEAQDMPLVPWAVKAVDGIFIDRSDLKQSLKCLVQVRERLRDNSMHMLIYPEGTRNKEPITTPVQSFHAGSFKPAVSQKRNILVIASYGSFRLLSTKDPKRNPVWMKFFPPVTPEMYEGMNTNEVADMCHKMIDDQVAIFKEKDKEYFEKKYQKVKLKKGKLM